MTAEQPAVDLDQVRGFVDRAVKAAVAPGDMVERKVRPESTYGWPEPRPLAGLQAALVVARMASDQAHRFAKLLRAEGTSWAALAGLLEIPWSADYVQRERAYELVAGSVGSSFSGDLRLYWTCGGPNGCGQDIIDYGPYDGFPADCERGHADDCRRHAAEREAFNQDLEERERRADVMDEALRQITETYGGDSFAVETVRRARYVQDHGGRYLGWSTSEALAVALALDDDEHLAAHGYETRSAALERVLSGAGRGRPEDPQEWLALLRAAATGRR